MLPKQRIDSVTYTTSILFLSIYSKSLSDYWLDSLKCTVCVSHTYREQQLLELLSSFQGLLTPLTSFTVVPNTSE